MGVNCTSGCCQSSGVSLTVGLGFGSPHVIATSFDHNATFHVGAAPPATNGVVGLVVGVVDGFAGVDGAGAGAAVAIDVFIALNKTDSSLPQQSIVDLLHNTTHG